MKKLILLFTIIVLPIFYIAQDGVNAKKPSVDGSKNEDKAGNSTENIKVNQTEVITKDYANGEPIELNDTVAIINEATNGEFTSIQGDYVVEGCEFENTSYEAKLIDLNSDGNPEVIITLLSGCMGGNTGLFSYLYAKDRNGSWEMILKDIGIPATLEASNFNWPEIFFAKAGYHYNLFKWNGKKYVFDRMHSPYENE